jgi:hypothetical protein
VEQNALGHQVPQLHGLFIGFHLVFCEMDVAIATRVLSTRTCIRMKPMNKSKAYLYQMQDLRFTRR